MKKYKIFYTDKTTGKSVFVTEFYAESRDAAENILNKYSADHKEDGNEYYYSGRFYYTEKNGKNMEFNSIKEMLEFKNEKISFIEKIKDKWNDICIWFSVKTEKFKRIKYFLQDLIFWLKNYNSFNNTSHMRSEAWSLYDHILNDIAFNIPAMKNTIDRGHGIPCIYCDTAREIIKKENENYKIPENSYSYTHEELTLAKSLWFNELDNLLRTIGMYYLYENYGHLSDDEYKLYKLDKPKEEYTKLIPYYPGTKNDINYTKLRELSSKAWSDIWNWIDKHGQNLWT